MRVQRSDADASLRTVIASGIVVALAIVSLYLCSSMQRSQRWLGATRAVRLHSAIGLRISRLLSERAVLLVGDSRIESAQMAPPRI